MRRVSATIVAVASNDCYTLMSVYNEKSNKMQECIKIYTLMSVYNEKSNKMQQCIKILLSHVYMKLNMFRATHWPSSGA